MPPVGDNGVYLGCGDRGFGVGEGKPADKVIRRHDVTDRIDTGVDIILKHNLWSEYKENSIALYVSNSLVCSE